jgi:hypothetical protein
MAAGRIRHRKTRLRALGTQAGVSANACHAIGG